MRQRESGVRGLFVENEMSLAERLRRRRWAILLQYIPDLQDLRVVDLGGTAHWWDYAPVVPRHVTVVNLYDPELGPPIVRKVAGDALQADELLNGEEFDLVFSNSLTEHLGGHGARRRFADVVSKLAAAYVIQTPYQYFPVEPHWMFPAFQFLPIAARSWLAPRWPLGHTRGWSAEAATNEVMSTELLSATEMRAYFPDSKIVWERVAGVPKSMIAIKRSTSAGTPEGTHQDSTQRGSTQRDTTSSRN
jgi:hypothetical protein